MTETEIKQRLRIWIAERCGKVAPSEIHDDTPIIEQRIVSSLHALELLGYIEQIRDRPLERSEIKPFMLRSIDAIYTGFFQAQP
jgi:hypothetical protein